jgi:ABC-type uncharacterized transport system substrate-binding protein
MCGILTITVRMAEAPVFAGVFDDNAEPNGSRKKVVKRFAFFAYCMPYRRLKSPTIFNIRDYVQAGGLMSYGPNFPDQFRRTADLVDKILRGTKPADIPVEQPTKFELVINVTTAKTLGLTVPPTLLSRADEVIE